MSEGKAVSALLSRLDSKIYGESTIDFAMPGVPYKPLADTPFISVAVTLNNHAAQALSSGGMVQMQGLLTLSVMWPKGQGVMDAMQIADEIKADWPRGLRIDDDSRSVVVTVVRSPYMAGPFEESTRTQVAVVIPWQALSRAEP